MPTVPLSSHCIAAFSKRCNEDFDIHVVPETGSTNTDLLQQVSSLNKSTLLIAQRQTAGRGRDGRSWHGDADAGLAFSLAWKFTCALHTLSGLPLAIGVTVAETLASFGIDVALKWPNDLLRNGGKVGGILIETARCFQSESTWAIVGIGLNITATGMLRRQVEQPIAAMPELARVDRAKLIAALADDLAAALSRFSVEGLAGFADAWNLKHAYRDQDVVILNRGRTIHAGKAADIDTYGRLLIRTATDTVAVTAGDVSLRLQPHLA